MLDQSQRLVQRNYRCFKVTLGGPLKQFKFIFFSEVVAIHGVRFLEENVCSTAEPPSRLKTEGTVEAAVTWLFVDSRMFEAKAITLRPQVRSQAHVRSAMSVPAMVSCRFSHEPTQ